MVDEGVKTLNPEAGDIKEMETRLKGNIRIVYEVLPESIFIYVLIHSVGTF